MRARNLKPGFFKNAELAELPYETRILFQGLWCLADRKGRLIDRPKQVKGEIFPYDSITAEQVDTMLAQLQHGAFIIRYEKDTNRYIQINNFEKHQYPHIKEADSTIPAPYKPRAKTIPARLNPESPILNPESLLPAIDFAGVFESLWLDYPKRLGKKGALRHFMSSVKSEADVRSIRKALAAYKQHIQGKDRQYIKHGDTWFNNWTDWTNFTEENPNAPHGGTSISEQVAKRLREVGSETSRTQELTAGAVLARVRNLPTLQHETGTVPGSGDDENGNDVGRLRDEEAQ